MRDALISNISDNQKEADLIVDIQKARAIIKTVGEPHQTEVINELRALTYNNKELDYEKKAQKIIENMADENILNIANVLWKDKYNEIPEHIRNF